MKYYIGLFIAIIISFAMMWNMISLKAVILGVSVFSTMLFFNIVVTTLSKAFRYSDIDVNYDIFWKLLLIAISSIGFAIYFNI